MIRKGYDEALAKAIAKDSGSAQFRADVSCFCRFAHIGSRVMGFYYDEASVLVGYFLKGNNYRILGVGTREQEKGKGYGSILLKAAENEVLARGGNKVTTLTKVASEWYARRGYDCAGINHRGEYIMEKAIHGND